MQLLSGMSWADAKKTMGLPSFSRMVFNYQCRYIMIMEHRDNCPQCRKQAERMKGLGLFNAANQEVGEIIVCDVNKGRVKELLAADKAALLALIGK